MTRRYTATRAQNRRRIADPGQPVVPAASDLAGIPATELTPHVRKAIAGLRAEIKALREELELTRAHLEQAGHAADLDHLLPLLNRRAFLRELTRHVGFAARYGTPACLLYFDLDGFKQINDTLGHAGGDAVLAHFADVLLANVRDSDVVGRLGGDEFGIILAHARQAQAEKKAGDLMEVLKKRPALWNGRKIPLGFSSGSFELVRGDSAETAMARADAAMYRRKRVTR